MKLVVQFTSYGLVFLLVSIFLLVGYASIKYDPHWDIEEQAVPTNDHPMSGFWKQGGCEAPWGLAIGPVSSGVYYISFCGPGGCLDHGEYRPNTSLLNDPDYKVIDENTLMYQSEKGWSTMVRCRSLN
jgi:hypothetical protein